MRVTFLVIALLGLLSGIAIRHGCGARDRECRCHRCDRDRLASSIARKGAGVSAHIAEHDARTERVAAMTGIDRASTTEGDGGSEFDPAA